MRTSGGFTGFTESADAEDVMALLRDYHAAIGEIIIKYNGTLERYAGDGVMVVFNDPVPVENPALQAVLMAFEVREAIGALTEKWQRTPRTRSAADLALITPYPISIVPLLTYKIGCLHAIVTHDICIGILSSACQFESLEPGEISSFFQ